MAWGPKFSKSHASHAIKIDTDKYTLMGAQGYRSALAVCRRSASSLYFEAQIKTDEGYARIGIATVECELNGPIGIDKFGYSYGNKNGYGFHKSKRVYFGERLKKDDIFGVYLYKSEDDLKLYFFINGQRVARGFDNITHGEYWPAISLYNKCQVTCNFGPYFAYEIRAKNEVDHLNGIIKPKKADKSGGNNKLK